jgi:hypothetical protein
MLSFIDTMDQVLLLAIISLCLVKLNRKKVIHRSRWSTRWLRKRGRFSHVNLLRELRYEPEDWRKYLRMDRTLI